MVVRDPHSDVLLLPLCRIWSLDAALPLVEEIPHHAPGRFTAWHRLPKTYPKNFQLVQFVMVFFHAMQPIFFQCDFPLAARSSTNSVCCQKKILIAYFSVWCSVVLDCNTSSSSVHFTKRHTGFFICPFLKLLQCSKEAKANLCKWWDHHGEWDKESSDNG